MWKWIKKLLKKKDKKTTLYGYYDKKLLEELAHSQLFEKFREEKTIPITNKGIKWKTETK